MIPAAVWPRFARWFAGHAQRRLAGEFDRVHVRGLAELRALADARPILVVANHSSWWDAILALWISRALLEVDAWAMMDADNLRRHPYFVRVGGFGVARGSRSDGAAGIRYAADKLQRAGNCLWIFPQGEERPWHEDLVFRPGVSRVARLAPEAVVIPVALGYSFGSRERPEAWVSIGGPVTSMGLRTIRGAVDAQRQLILRGIEGSVSFEPHLPRRHSRLGAVAERLLAWISGFGMRHELPAASYPQRALPPRYPAGQPRAQPRGD